ncbi:hypothetical protein CHLNCDRAFT_52565 [Chlorella variabilis]|uniref:NADH:flavin oxidoreductase/NADH oxidase N-terminal domain-containing protein n=1 Tax=Chlorella variabilis TaxID=554065 RepID=E1ZFX2_CHLVA|nr:hypothetical protein CHLNCDRAFT_52565 [Chlorella variabilis]EFN55195.1 hypothetical protein CHLNCDRAFT_52565 [Chlorella variabilis]|eukprot:XP_005847297.1 hypothetical protein CHLNCDRAFT_52565 [Chlorella variabilis]
MTVTPAANGAAAAAPLFSPYTLPGGLQLPHRIVYAPITRCRAFNQVPQPNAALYYSQRASPGGLLITEATCISDRAHGYPCTPGIYTQEQIDAWKPIVDAVHQKEAIFFAQLWHVGRASHHMEDYPAPRQLDIAEIPAIVDQYRQAARKAVEAGFDGVEVHGANGYLIDQFLKDGINNRTDEYGGPIESRCRFALEVVWACCEEIGSEKELNKMSLAYVHVTEPRVGGSEDRDEGGDSIKPFREVYKGTLISAGGFTAATGGAAVESGHCDLVCYGRLLLANPDMPRRFQLGAPLNKYDRSTFYSQGSEAAPLPAVPTSGYTDYPFLEESEDGSAFLASLGKA